MSIIANALQKHHQHGVPRPVDSDSSNQAIWKVIILLALTVIIVLLSTLIWLVSRQPSLASVTVAQPLIQAAPAVSPLPLTTIPAAPQPTPLKSIAKVVFVTQPLPVTGQQSQLPEIAGLGGEQISVAPPSRLSETAQADLDLAAVTPVPPPEDTASATPSSEVSSELAARFHQAVAMSDVPLAEETTDSRDKYQDITQMAEDFQQQVPTIRYAFHVYSSISKDRWIRINGDDLKEGDFDRSGRLQVVEIFPNETVFRFADQEFSLQSLTDWQAW